MATCKRYRCDTQARPISTVIREYDLTHLTDLINRFGGLSGHDFSQDCASDARCYNRQFMLFLKSRVKHVGHIAYWWWAAIYGGWTLLCSVDVLVEHYASDSFKGSYNHAWIAPKSGWHVWIIGVLVITVLAIIEGSYRYSRAQSGEHRESLSKAEAAKAKAEAEARIYDGRPILVLEVGQPSQDGEPWTFKLRNAGQRAPRFIRIRSARSQLGNHVLHFGMVQTINSVLGECVPHWVDEYSSYEPKLLLDFFHDVDKHEEDPWRRPVLSAYDIEVAFWDSNNTELTQLVRLCYDFDSNVVSSMEVPYEKRTVTPQ